MKIEMFLPFEEGLPTATSQQKGFNRRTGTFYKKDKVESARRQFMFKMVKSRPQQPSDKPIALTICLYFNVKAPKRLWGTYKTTRPDCDNYAKELIDAMTDCGFWKDDAQIADLRIVKRYAEKGSIYIRVEDLAE